MEPILFGHTAFIQLAKTRDHVAALRAIQQTFTEHLAAHGASPGFERGITISGNAIETAVLGVELIAVPRVVRDMEQEFAIEYAFRPKEEEDHPAPVFLFYLRSTGRLSSKVGVPDIGWSDYQQERVVEDLLVRVNLTTLASDLFAPLAPLAQA